MIIPHLQRLTNEYQNNARNGRDDGNYPVAHHHFFSRPADSLEMLMERGHFENSMFVEKFVRNYLDDDRERSDNQRESDDWQ